MGFKHTYISVGLALVRSVERFAEDRRLVRECNNTVRLWVSQYSDEMDFPWLATSIDQADELTQAGCWVAECTLELLMALAKPRDQLNAEGRWIGTEAIYDLLDSTVAVQSVAAAGPSGLYLRQGGIAVRAFQTAAECPWF